MVNDADLKDTERRTYLSTFEDGLIDIVAGLPVLMFGLGMVFDSGMLFILTALPIALYLPLKQAVTVPRLGMVRFTPQRRQKTTRSFVLLLVAGTMSLLLALLVLLGDKAQVLDLRWFMVKYGLVVFGAVMAGAFFLISILLDIRRFIGYGVIVFGGWLAPHLVGIEEGISVTLAGGLVTLIGVGILVRFLTTTPYRREDL